MGLECKQQKNKNIVEIKIFFIIFGFLLYLVFIFRPYFKRKI